MDNEKWTLVANEEQFDQLLDLALEFHDAVSGAARWMGGEYLTPAGDLVLDGFGNLIVFTISQFPRVPDLELRFTKVQAFRYDYGSESTPVVRFATGIVHVTLLEWKIEAESFSYRALSSRALGMPDLS